MRPRVLLLLIIVAAVLASAFGCAQPSEEKPKTLTIGVSASMSGAGASWGQVFERATALAVQDINSKGGVKVGGSSYFLDMKTYDHAFDPAKATEIVKRMVQVDKVSWIITHGAAATKPNIPFTEENKVILMHMAAGNDVMNFMPQKYTFRMSTLTGPEAVLIWTWITQNRPDIKKAAGLNPDDASGQDWGKDFQKLITKLGVQDVYDAFYKRGVTDFYPILTAILAAKPDAIDMGSSAPADKGHMVKQARELGFKGAFIDEAINIPQLYDLAKEAVDGVLYADYTDPQTGLGTPEEKAFYDRYIQAYGQSSFNTLAFGIVPAIYPVVEAIEKANSLDPDKVTEQLHSGASFDVLGRKVQFSGVGDFGTPPRQAKGPLMIGELGKDGKPKWVKVVDFPTDY